MTTATGVTGKLGRWLAGPTRKIIAAVIVVAVVVAIVLIARPSPATPAVSTTDVTITAPGGPGVGGTVSLDATVYRPATTPAPAVIMAHGFGGSKESVAADARDLAGHGFVVLAYSARGFGNSTGQIGLDSLDYEIPDARALVDWLARQPEVIQDGPGDPRVGVTGGSYGGALSLMLAGTDKRIDAVVPLITWNDLSQALFPNAIDPSGQPPATPAGVTGIPGGVFKKAWAASLIASVTTGGALSAGPAGTAPTDSGDSGFGRGSATSAAAAPGGTAAGAGTSAPSAGAGPAAAQLQSVGCGRLMPALCAAYSQAAQTGRLSPAFSALLARSSPKAVVGNITAPTLLVQGEVDTLFGLDQSDANARAIAGNGTTVAMTWYNGGHDGGSPDQVTRDRITGWFQHYLSGTGAAPSTGFVYGVNGPLADNGRTRTRTLQAQAYPGISGAAPTIRTQVALNGGTQVAVNPPGGSPAGISSLPGLSGLVGSALSAVAGGLPGQTARFTSAPLPALTVISGTPLVTVTIAGVSTGGPTVTTGSATSDEGAVLFASLSKVSAGGVRTLAGNAVAPIRLTDLPADGSTKTVTIALPAVAFQVEAGSSIQVSLSTTDQAYAGPTAPAVYQISLAGSKGVSLPEVGGVRVSAGEIPVGTLIGLIALALIAVLALLLGGRVRHRRKSAALPVSGATIPAIDAKAMTDRVSVGDRASTGGGPIDGAAVDGAAIDEATIDEATIDGVATDRALTGLTTGPAAGGPSHPPAAEIPLVISGLGKSYPGGVAAVTDVSFTVERGQVLGLLGPNGAGKTTTLRMVMGLITPTAGEIRVFGQLVRPGGEILSRIGSFVEGSGFLPHLSGQSNLELYWRATGRPAADAHLDAALEIAGLGGAIRRRVKTYSQGMRQRLAIAQAMLGLPDLLLLDEPTNGLDPPQIHAMREVLRGYAATGRTVLVSSHLLSEVEQTCSHVVVVHQGATIAAGTVAELVSTSGDMIFTVDDPAGAIAVLRGLSGVGEVGAGDAAGSVRADLRRLPATDAVAALVQAGVGVSSAAPRNRLEDVFLELVGASGPSGAGPAGSEMVGAGAPGTGSTGAAG